MTDEKEVISPIEYGDNELLNIIDNQLIVLSTIADIADSEYRTYDDEIIEMNVVKKNAYRIIHAAQKKIQKYIKTYEFNIENNDE
jgi:hypothetical protein